MPASAASCDPKYLETYVKIYKTSRYYIRELKKIKKQPSLIEQFKNKIIFLEKQRWIELVNMNRKDGLTPERKTGRREMYNQIINRSNSAHPNDEVYPFHFRAGKVFRVFGYQYKAGFYITNIDPKHKKHR